MEQNKKLLLQELAREIEMANVTDEECAKMLRDMGATEDELMRVLDGSEED